MRASVLILLILLTIPRCASNAANEEFRDRDWKLVWVEGVAAMPAGIEQPTLRFSTDGRVTGNTGCNSAGAAYTVDADRLSVGLMISTKRACLAREGNELEGHFIRAITGARKIRAAQGELELLDADGKTVARFR